MNASFSAFCFILSFIVLIPNIYYCLKGCHIKNERNDNVSCFSVGHSQRVIR